MLIKDVAPGIHMIQRGNVNCYLVEDDSGLTLVDAGLPGTWNELGWAIRSLDRSPEEVRALVLTHAHFDHVGMAHKLVARLGLPVYAHAEERELAAHPYRYEHERPTAIYPFKYPRAVPGMASMLACGAFAVRGVETTRLLDPGTAVPVPGGPRVLLTAGHTHGHCSLHFPDRDAVISGDALVTLDPYTGRSGPRIVAGAATWDSDLALRSLDTIAATGARTVLPGHGRVWTGGAQQAVAEARRNGPA